jgi:hypothetical protein
MLLADAALSVKVSRWRQAEGERHRVCAPRDGLFDLSIVDG